jgi:hypothetical protein
MNQAVFGRAYNSEEHKDSDAGIVPLSRLKLRYSHCRSVIEAKPLGIVPVSWLLFSLRSLLTQQNVDVPQCMTHLALTASHRSTCIDDQAAFGRACLSDEHMDSDAGIVPLSRLKFKYSHCRLIIEAKPLGIVPVSWLLDRPSVLNRHHRQHLHH